MIQLPEEIIIRILSELGDLEVFVQLSNCFSNRYIFPCLFKNVIVRHESPRDPRLPTDYLYYDLQQVYILEQSDGLCLFRFWLEESVNVLSSDLDKMFWLDPIKPYISNVEFHLDIEDHAGVENHLDIEDSDILHWGKKVESFLSDTSLESFLCNIRLDYMNKYRGLRKLTLYDPDLITSYGTTSITNLRLYDRDIPTKDMIIELSEQVFPSLKRLEVNGVWIKVLDLNCHVKELYLCNVSPEYYPSIHKLRELKALTLEIDINWHFSRKFFDEKITRSEFPTDIVNEKSESLESLVMKYIDCSSLSLHFFPKLKSFCFERGSLISLENAPLTLEELYISAISFVGSPNIKYLNLRKISIHIDLGTLGNIFSECLNLSEADFSENRIKEIPDIIEHPNITRLSLKYNNLHQLGSFFFPKLKFLDLSSNGLFKIGSLRGCQSLKHLDVSCCKLKNIDFIKNLMELEEFHAENNEISSVKPLAGKTELRTLNLNRNQLTDVSPLNSCTNLKRLLVSFNKVKTADLIELKHLSELDVSNNLVSKFEYLRLNDSVNELRLQGNGMTVLKGNRSLRNVKYLDVTSNRIKKSKDVHELQSLEKLSLDDNSISNLNGFDGLRNLKNLTLHMCPIKSLDVLSKLSTLELVSFYRSKIKTLDGDSLRGLKNLTDLEIKQSSLRFLKNMTMLPIKKLELHGNEISILDGIESLPKLLYLDLSYNRINRIGSFFGNFPKLKVLILESNPLQTASGLEKIKSNDKLTIFGNHLDISSPEFRDSNIKFF